jgi:hypothetical protein
MLESTYQARLIKKLKKLFPGCVVLKNDSGYQQGVPDLSVLYNDRWAMLEVKVSADADEQPNQRYHVEKLDQMSFAAFIYPENEAEVLDELQHALGATRQTLVS